MIKRFKKWLRKHKKWQGTNSNYVSDYEKMKEEIKKNIIDNNEVIYLKPRGFGKTTMLNDIISDFEKATGTELENWQKEITIMGVGLCNKTLYRNMRTGQIMYRDKPISVTEVVNMHTKAESEADRPKNRADLVVLNEQQKLDKKFLEKIASQMPKYPPNTPNRENTITGVKTIPIEDVNWITKEKLAEIKKNSKPLTEWEFQNEYMADYYTGDEVKDNPKDRKLR